MFICFLLFIYRPPSRRLAYVLAPFTPRYITLSLPPPPYGRCVVRSLLVDQSLVARLSVFRPPSSSSSGFARLSHYTLARFNYSILVICFLALRLVVVVSRLLCCFPSAPASPPFDLWGARTQLFFSEPSGDLIIFNILCVMYMLLYIQL